MSRTYLRRIAGLILVYSAILFIVVSPNFADAADTNPSDMTDVQPQLDVKVGLEPGNVAPTFVGTDLDGNTIDLQEVAGRSKYILLDFWASYCGPCRAEFPHLRKLNDQYKDRGLQIIGICSDTDRDTAARAAEQGELNYPHVYHANADQQSVTDLYQVTGIPQTYILDSNLRVIDKGLRGSTLEQRIEKLFLVAELANLKPNDTVVVAAEKAQLKVINDVLAELPKGQQLPVVTTQGDWIWTYIDQDGKRTEGWVNAKLIAVARDHGKQSEGKQDAVNGEMSRGDVESVAGDMVLIADNSRESGGVPVKTAKWESPAPPAPATPEPAEWELTNPDEMPRLFEFAGTRNLKSDLKDEAVGEIGRFQITGTAMTCAAVAPNGRFVVSGGDDAVIRLWDAETGREIRQFKGHTSKILTLAFSADGRHVLSGGGDASVRLWDVDAGEELHCYTGHESDVISVAFAPGGRFATSTGRDQTLRMWKLPTATMQTQTRRHPSGHLVHRRIVDDTAPVAAAATPAQRVAVNYRPARNNGRGSGAVRAFSPFKSLWMAATNVTDSSLRSLLPLQN